MRIALVFIGIALLTAAWLHGFNLALRRAAARYRRTVEEIEASRKPPAPPAPDDRSFKLKTVQFKR